MLHFRYNQTAERRNEYMHTKTGGAASQRVVRNAARAIGTHVHFSIYDVYKASKHNDEIKHIPRITKVILSRRRSNKHHHKPEPSRHDDVWWEGGGRGRGMSGERGWGV